MNQQTTRPQTATEILKLAGNTLGERGKQYDPAGKQERSMTAIVAAFNAIYPRNPLTVHMGWQFMSLVKMVRGATKPHADSALDQVAYAALAAEEVAEQLHGQGQLREAYAHNPYAGKAAVEEEPEPTAGKRVEQLLSANQALAEELGKCQHWAGIQSQELKHLTDKLAAQQELLSVAQHNANFYFDKTNGCIAANESMTAKFQAERKANVAMHEEVTRLHGKVQDLADLAEYRDKRNAELCAELSRAQDEIQSLLAEKRNLTARNKELEDKVQSLNNEVEAKVRELMSNLRHEAPCAHNTDEPKAPRPEYVDPFDQYGDMRSPMHRLVGSLDPARGGLAYPQGKDAPTPQ